MILVTGGTGFLGSTIINQLIEQEKPIIATKRIHSTIPDTLKTSPFITWVDADVTDYFALNDIFENITQVYHCAAKVSYQKNDANLMNSTNIEGTKHIVNLCLEYGARLIHVSSIAALGKNKSGLPISENDKWEYEPSMSKYSLSKYKSELEVWRGIHEGLDAVIVNPSLIMGAAAGKKGSGVIFELVDKGMPLYPQGTIGIVDVEDVANIMIQLMEQTEISGERFILNSDNISNKDLLATIAKFINKKAPHIEAKPYLLGIAWRVAKIASILSGKEPALTKESLQASSSKLAYSNQKIGNTLHYQFKPIDSILQHIATKNYNQPRKQTN